MPTETMTSWQLDGFGPAQLRLVEGPVPQPGPHDLLVRVGAVSLNYRDRMIMGGALPELALPFVPASDAAGEVVAIGAAVRKFAPGDRVVSHYWTEWLDGEAPPGVAAHQGARGGPLPGVLAEYILLHEEAAVAAPASLGDAEAATLPIAGLTAWFALFEAARTTPGQLVLVQGTGGVSLFALQLATAAGARVIVTSGSDEKLERARALGAWAGVNHAQRPDWHEAVRALTGGRGVDHVLEIVGGDNLGRSLEAVAPGGRISLIGILAGTIFSLPAVPAFLKRVTLQGITVGHRRALETLRDAIDTLGIKPVIDRVYPFADLPGAFAALERGPFGKIVIALR